MPTATRIVACTVLKEPAIESRRLYILVGGVQQHPRLQVGRDTSRPLVSPDELKLLLCLAFGRWTMHM